MPSGNVDDGEMGRGGWGVSKRPVLQLIKGEILQVAGCLSQEKHVQRQRIHTGGERLSSFLGGVLYNMWISDSVWVMLLLMYWERERRRREPLLYWALDVGIFPLCRLSYPLPEVPGSQCHKWRSQSLFIITLTFNIKNTFKHDWMFDGVILWLI